MKKRSRSCTKRSKLDPGYYFPQVNPGRALEIKGAQDSAIAEYQKARALNDDPAVLGLLAHIHAAPVNKTEAFGLGDKEEALRWLEKSYQDRAESDIGYLRADPLLDRLHGNPRFEMLAEKDCSGEKFGKAQK